MYNTIVQSQNGNALSSSFLKASKIAILAIKSINPPIKENTADIINKLRTVKVYFENVLPFGIAKFLREYVIWEILIDMFLIFLPSQFPT